MAVDLSYLESLNNRDKLQGYMMDELNMNGAYISGLKIQKHGNRYSFFIAGKYDDIDLDKVKLYFKEVYRIDLNLMFSKATINGLLTLGSSTVSEKKFDKILKLVKMHEVTKYLYKSLSALLMNKNIEINLSRFLYDHKYTYKLCIVDYTDEMCYQTTDSIHWILDKYLKDKFEINKADTIVDKEAEKYGIAFGYQLNGEEQVDKMYIMTKLEGM